jgi:hypothetical protein
MRNNGLGTTDYRNEYCSLLEGGNLMHALV